MEYKDPYSRVDHTPFARAPSLWDKIAYRIGGQRVGYVFVHSCNDKFSLQYVTELDNIEALDIPLFPNGELSLLARLDSLIYLNLDGTPIVDLSPLSKLENLQVLRLCDTPIRDVRPLLGLKNLKHLYLNNTVVTDEQVREIRDVLPNCEVHYSFRFSDEPLVPQVFNSS
ncbi:MAG: leucine-rich repeat domain-containing protein [Pirellulaceae bacterium]